VKPSAWLTNESSKTVKSFKIKTKRRQWKIKSYKSLPVKLFFSSLPYFLAQSQNLTKGKGRHNMCEDIVMKTSSTDNCEYSRDQT